MLDVNRGAIRPFLHPPTPVLKDYATRGFDRPNTQNGKNQFGMMHANGIKDRIRAARYPRYNSGPRLPI
jgi:hypothetical protein